MQIHFHSLCTTDVLTLRHFLKKALIEIGAGKGIWARAIANRGADIIAFDNFSEVPETSAKEAFFVYDGDERQLSTHPGRTLLLVYPPPGQMARQCLTYFRGNTILYAGEGRGGANGDESFFAALEKDWEVVEVVDLDPFPECFEKLFVLRRR